MKILFVNPSLRPNAPHRYLPVGLGYVVTAAERAGFSFDILDIDIGHYSDADVEQYLVRNRYDVIAIGSIVTHYRWVKWFLHMAREKQPDCTLLAGNSVGGSVPELLLNNSPVDIIIQGEADETIVSVL